MQLSNTLFLLMGIYLKISLLELQVQCQQGVMSLNSTIYSMQGYSKFVFDDSVFPQFVECLFKKETNCKAYYYNMGLSVNKVYKIEISTSSEGKSDAYHCVDVSTFRYVICSIIALPCSTNKYNSFPVTIMWTDNKEYFYSEGVRNCSLSCSGYSEKIFFVYGKILTNTSSSDTLYANSDGCTTPMYGTSKISPIWTTVNTTVNKTDTKSGTTTIVVVVVIVVFIVICIILGVVVWRRNKKTGLSNSVSTNGTSSLNHDTDYPVPDNKTTISDQFTADSSNRYVIQVQSNTGLTSDSTDGYTTIDDSDLAKMSRVVITNTEHNTGDYTELEIDEQSSANGSVLASSSLDTEDTTSSNNVNSPESDGQVDYSDIKFDPSNTTYARLGEDNRQLTNPYGGLADIKEVSNLSPYTLAKDIPGHADLQIINPGCFNEKD